MIKYSKKINKSFGETIYLEVFGFAHRKKKNGTTNTYLHVQQPRLLLTGHCRRRSP